MAKWLSYIFMFYHNDYVIFLYHPDMWTLHLSYLIYKIRIVLSLPKTPHKSLKNPEIVYGEAL